MIFECDTYHFDENPTLQVKCINADNFCIGVVSAEIVDNTAHIDSITVPPMFQGMGVGSGLIRELESTAQQLGVSKFMIVNFHPELPSRRDSLSNFYRRLGYSAVEGTNNWIK